jgi:hypothetical protein
MHGESDRPTSMSGYKIHCNRAADFLEDGQKFFMKIFLSDNIFLFRKFVVMVSTSEARVSTVPIKFLLAFLLCLRRY